METQIKAARTLLKEQKRLQSKGKDAASATGRGMRYDPIVIRHALLLYQKGPAAYAAAQKTQRLPSVRRLREYRNWTSHKAGLNTDLLLEMEAVMREHGGEGARDVILAFDGMTVKEGIFFDRFSGTISGMEDLGDLVAYTQKQFQSSEGEPEIEMAKECMQFIATSVDGKFRVPVGYYLVRNCTAGMISTMVDSVIVALDSVGVAVKVICCDGASFHRKWQEDTLRFVDHAAIGSGDANAHTFKVAMRHPLYPIDPQRKHLIYIMSDPVHLIKKMASNLFSSGETEGHTRDIEKLTSKPASLDEAGRVERLQWDQLKYAWQQDQDQAVLGTLAPRVTRQHIERDAWSRLKTNMSTRVLSHSMQLCVQAYNTEPVGELLQLMAHMDRYIDIMNSGHKRSEWTGSDPVTGKAHLNHPIRSMTDRRIIELQEMLKWFEAWDDENKQRPASNESERSARFLTHELYFDLRLAVRGFLAFAADFLADNPSCGLIPRLYSQDCVEGRFSLVRGSGGARTAVSSVELASAQASADVQTNGGGVRGNITAVHDQVEHVMVGRLQSRAVTRAERKERVKVGEAMAAAAGIDLPN